MSSYYVVHKGRNPGIYRNWNDCKKEIDKYDGALFKKFSNQEEANEFLKNGFGEGKKPRIVTRRENDDKKNNNIIEQETSDLIDDGQKIFIYTDGSCIKQIRAGYGIYIPERNIQVGKPLLNQKITNNRAELTAIIECVSYLDEIDLNKKLCIFTDSQYSMYLFHGTGERYEKDGYKKEGKDVPNIDLIKKLLSLKRKYNIVLLKLRAHTEKKDIHSKGNEIADKLANSGANDASVNIPKNSHFSCEKNNFYEDDEEIIEGNKKKNFFKHQYNNNNNVENDKKRIILKSKIPDANIKIHELFEFSESESSSKYGKAQTSVKINKNTKLTQWFTKKD